TLHFWTAWPEAIGSGVMSRSATESLWLPAHEARLGCADRSSVGTPRATVAKIPTARTHLCPCMSGYLRPWTWRAHPCSFAGAAMGARADAVRSNAHNIASNRFIFIAFSFP